MLRYSVSPVCGMFMVCVTYFWRAVFCHYAFTQFAGLCCVFCFASMSVLCFASMLTNICIYVTRRVLSCARVFGRCSVGRPDNLFLHCTVHCYGTTTLH